MTGVDNLSKIENSTEKSESTETTKAEEVSPYDKIDLTKCSVKELKNFCADAKLELTGPFEKAELIEEAKKAIEILKNNPTEN